MPPQNQNQPQLKDYQIHLPPLGEGAFGTVYHATYRGISDRAVKIFKPDTVDLPTMARELEKLSLMAEHPGIVTLHDFDLVAETPYYAMGLHADRKKDGTWKSRTLEDLCGRVGQREAARLIDQIADAMGYLHRHQVLHCDLKPSNVMITDEIPPRIKICDFGQSRGAARNTPDAVGTPLYSSPEQLLKPDESSGGAGFKWDVYSFGVLAFKLVTGRLPRLQQLLTNSDGSGADSELDLSILDETRHEDSLGESTLNRSGVVAEQLFEEEEVEWPADAPIDNRRKAIITRCLSLDRNERPADMREVHDLIERSLNERRVTRQRNWIALFASITLIAILATFFAGYEAYQARKASRAEQEARESAEELVRFILTDLRQNLDAEQQVELLEHIVENADTYINNLPTDRQTADTIRTIASALHTKAAFALGRGNAGLAAETYGQLIAIYERIIDGGGETNGRIRFALAEARSGMGDALRAQGRFEEALEFYENAIAMRDVENLKGAPEAIYLRNTANIHARAGRVLNDLERHADAVDQFGEAVRIHRILRDNFDSTQPGADDWRVLAAMNELAAACRLNQDDETAENLFEQVIELAAENGRYARRAPMAQALHGLGRIELDAGRPLEARKLFEQELQLREDLHRIERSNPMRGVELARCLASLAECYDLAYEAERALAIERLDRAVGLVEAVGENGRFAATAGDLKVDLEARLEAISGLGSDR